MRRAARAAPSKLSFRSALVDRLVVPGAIDRAIYETVRLDVGLGQPLVLAIGVLGLAGLAIREPVTFDVIVLRLCALEPILLLFHDSSFSVAACAGFDPLDDPVRRNLPCSEEKMQLSAR
jgi:hypothetical protein